VTAQNWTLKRSERPREDRPRKYHFLASTKQIPQGSALCQDRRGSEETNTIASLIDNKNSEGIANLTRGAGTWQQEPENSFES